MDGATLGIVLLGGGGIVMGLIAIVLIKIAQAVDERNDAKSTPAE